MKITSGFQTPTATLYIPHCSFLLFESRQVLHWCFLQIHHFHVVVVFINCIFWPKTLRIAADHEMTLTHRQNLKWSLIYLKFDDMFFSNPRFTISFADFSICLFFIVEIPFVDLQNWIRSCHELNAICTHEIYMINTLMQNIELDFVFDFDPFMRITKTLKLMIKKIVFKNRTFWWIDE